MKVGIYSGSFDPIHKGHVDFALSAVEEFDLKKVFFLPEPRPRRKQGVKAFEHRSNMIDLAIKDKPELGMIILGHKQFLVSDTLPVLLERFKGAELFMLMGDDMLDHFMLWPHVEDLISKVNFIITTRKYSKQHVQDVIKNIQNSTGAKFNYKIIEGQNIEVSSRKIRHNIKKSDDFSGLDESTKLYIKANGLYSIGEK